MMAIDGYFMVNDGQGWLTLVNDGQGWLMMVDTGLVMLTDGQCWLRLVSWSDHNCRSQVRFIGCFLTFIAFCSVIVFLFSVFNRSAMA